MHIPVTLKRRLESIEHTARRVIFVCICEWDVVVIERPQQWTPVTSDECRAIQQEEDRRMEQVYTALDELLKQALDAGHDHLTYRVYGSDAGLVRIASSLGVYELDVPCLPGRRCTCPRGPMVFVYRSDDDPRAWKPPAWGAEKQRYLARYGLKG